ncbi:structural constituent of cuticle [Nesidiocoris tenuis]|uniref:Structural constituent of cuticle n=1 Tax=Nesidiocoris tenuis TaxID=355587 RepID=A0ABN7AXL1_9HEMI|nr:structural constituent of cuticle [Nesidiocoris tenuis]
MKRFCVLLLAVGFVSGGQVALEHVGQITSQYHSQDELGQYSYGYSGGPSSKQEIKTADGVTRGGYSYIDANGLVQSAAYVSDPVNGFRVAATNLPAGPAVPAAPAVVAAAPAVVAAAPAVVAPAPAVVAAAPAVVASAPAVIAQAPAAVAPVPVAEGPAVTAVNVQEVAAAPADLPEVIAARAGVSVWAPHSIAAPTVVAARTIAHPLAATSWSGLVHHLKKRSIATVVTPLTSYPGSTAPLVHSAPVIAASPIIAHTPVVATHSAVLAAPAVHGWSGLVHALKKRSVLIPSAYYAGSPLLISPHAEPLHTAILRQAHEITKAQEALRNTAGVIPLNSPADTPDVEITKVNHVLQVAAEGQRNTLGGIHHLGKRSIWASPLIASPYGVVLAPHAEPLHTALLRQAHEITKAQEALRNTAGVIPLNSPADTPDVEITKVNHVLQVAAEGQRNTLGGIHHLGKRSIWGSPLVAAPYGVVVAPNAEPLHTAILRQAHEITKAQEALRNTAGVIPLNSPADTPDVEITKVNHVLQVAAEGQRNTYGGIPAASHLLSSHSVIAL